MLHHVPKKAQESARGFSFCDRCGLPRGTKNCHACESLSLQPGQQQMNPQWEARDDHQIGHLLRHGQALSFFPPLQCISKVRLWLIFRIETVISPRRCCRVLCPKILLQHTQAVGNLDVDNFMHLLRRRCVLPADESCKCCLLLLPSIP
ncbi:hypothetical protein TGRH88_027740 [Toxoplasma gondii]|uniref:Uncharacterized protein n=1 Tax=Toxoplasma gondii TaxID=5811 RepID=A0A7J6K7R2_TOXGO|nr:hypothetical protein TGRH88_027740 [Toxoplasma gondii]